MEKKLALKKYGSQLWTRERARGIRADLVKLLDSSNSGDVIAIDAKGVEVFDYSFANELFGKTLLSLTAEYPGRFLIVENLTAYTRENLAKALEALNLMMIEREGKELKLIGKTHPTDIVTFNLLVKATEPISTSEVKERLGINLTAVNERLTKLVNLGVLRREKGTSTAGREQYLYSTLR